MSLLILSLVHLVHAGEGAPALVGLRWGESPGSRALAYLCWGRTPALVCLYRGTSPGSRGRLYLRSGAVKV